jgi:hypothetical protein
MSPAQLKPIYSDNALQNSTLRRLVQVCLTMPARAIGPDLVYN